MTSTIITNRIQAGILENQCLISGRGRDFSHLHSIQNNSKANKTSYLIGNLGLFSGSKICGGVMLTFIWSQRSRKTWATLPYHGRSWSRLWCQSLPFTCSPFTNAFVFSMVTHRNSWKVLCPLHLLLTRNISVCFRAMSVGSLPVI
jgi:hypothetical protein